MKQSILLVWFLLFLVITGFTQVGINTDGSVPHQSAILDVKSTNMGFLPPRMTTQQRNNIYSPVTGLTIYNTDCHDLQCFDGGSWLPIGNRSQVTTPSWINGDYDPCEYQMGVNYSVSTVPDATGYYWTVPPGAVITYGQGTDFILVDMANANGKLCVTALNECGRSAPFCQSISYLPIIPPPLVSIEVNANPVCSLATVTFLVEVAFSGVIENYQWYKNGNPVSNNATYSYVPSSGDVVFCTVNTWDECNMNLFTSSEPITMTVIPYNSVSVSIYATSTSVCTGGLVTFTANATNGGPSPVIQWRKNGTDIPGAMASTYTYTPANNDLITCRLTSNISCPLGNPAISNGITMTVQSSLTKSHVAGLVAPVSKSVTYGLISNIPGEASKCWITRNLGASSQATAVTTNTEAAAGWYWQFNRKQGYKHDGTTLTPAWTTSSINQNSDWTLTNDPCAIELGGSWRIPTLSEWANVDVAGNWANWNDPWNSGLKLHASGYLINTNGSLSSRGSNGFCWSSTQYNATDGWYLNFSSGGSLNWFNTKAVGNSVRCIRE